MKSYKKLDESSQAKLKDAIALITILVAGADGNIDLKEADWAGKLTEIRSYSIKKDLNTFYQEVGEDYQERFDYFIQTLPVGLEARNADISRKLSELNGILSKLDNKFASLLYDDMLSFASHVAKKTGGFLGFLTVSRAEEKVMGLSMIDRIEYIEEE